MRFDLFSRAIELDGEFASAYGMAAWCYVWRTYNGWMADLVKESVEGARLARRAVELGKDDVVALSRGGYGLCFLAGDFDSGCFSSIARSNSIQTWRVRGSLAACSETLRVRRTLRSHTWLAQCASVRSIPLSTICRRGPGLRISSLAALTKRASGQNDLFGKRKPRTRLRARRGKPRSCGSAGRSSTSNGALAPN